MTIIIPTEDYSGPPSLDELAKTVEGIRRRIGDFELEHALLTIGRVLSVHRGFLADKSIAAFLMSLKFVPVFHLRTVAKWLALRASKFSPDRLEPHSLGRLLDQLQSLPDPIAYDAEWASKNPAGALERMFSHQLPTQNENVARYALSALTIFRDAAKTVQSKTGNLRSRIDAVLGNDIEDHLALAFVAFAAHAGPSGMAQPGTLNHMYLALAFANGFIFANPDTWGPFLDRMSASPDEFRSHYTANRGDQNGDIYFLFEFNPLFDRPLIRLGDKFIAPDPMLVWRRATKGILRDVSESDSSLFESIGEAVALAAAQLLGSVVPHEKLWVDDPISLKRNSDPRSANFRGDIIIRMPEGNVAIECKAMRPTGTFLIRGDESGAKHFASRAADALRQVMDHCDQIERGEWLDHGLSGNTFLCVLVTLGDFYSSRLPFIKKLVEGKLHREGKQPRRWAIISFDELDRAVSLIEDGNDAWSVFGSMEIDGAFGSFHRDYSEPLAKKGISRFSLAKWDEFADRKLKAWNAASDPSDDAARNASPDDCG